MMARTANRTLALAPLGMSLSTPYLTTSSSYAATLDSVQPQEARRTRGTRRREATFELQLQLSCCPPIASTL